MEWTKEKIKIRLEEIKKDVMESGKKTKGKKELIDFCEGKPMTLKKAVYAHCYECLGYQDNPGENRDCENPVCPIYPFAPYSVDRKKRVLTDEQRDEARKRFLSRKKTS